LDFSAVAFGCNHATRSAALRTIRLEPRNTGRDTALSHVLAAFGVYIAVPAAMRLAMPKAKHSIYLTLSPWGYLFRSTCAVGDTALPLFRNLIQG